MSNTVLINKADGIHGLIGSNDGQVLTYDATSGSPIWKYPATNNSNETLCSAFNITGASGVYQDTGNSVSLNAGAGIYLVYVTARTTINVTTGAGAFITIKLFNSTAGSTVTNTERIGPYANNTGVLMINEVTIMSQITVAAPGTAQTIKLYAARNTGTVYGNSSIDSDVNGKTIMGWIKIL